MIIRIRFRCSEVLAPHPSGPVLLKDLRPLAYLQQEITSSGRSQNQGQQCGIIIMSQGSEVTSRDNIRATTETAGVRTPGPVNHVHGNRPTCVLVCVCVFYTGVPHLLTLQQACYLLRGCRATREGAGSWSRAAPRESRRRRPLRRRKCPVGTPPPFAAGERRLPAGTRPPPPAAPPGLQSQR